MEIIGDRKYVEIPGEKTHELPPLLVRTAPEVTPLDEMMDMAAGIVDDEDLVPSLPADDWSPDSVSEKRKFDLALNLAEHYLKFIGQWQWGDSVLEWIRQCEITFESEANLRNLLRPDLWPHAGRSSFVTLLSDKSVPTRGIVLENAVGLRLTFRQPPPIACFSNQFLFYLNNPVAVSAYQTWAHLNSETQALLPPERFHFQVLSMAC
ncbi:MAG TPA: hypothetical protein VEU62_00670 [Bryobacterales bacterium]|nr:hypothetical protein [Bryobacterales bacterium]